MAKPSVTLRNTKAAALTYTELDTNFANLRDATVTVKAGTAGTDVVSDLNGTITLVAGTNVTLTGNNTAKTITIDASGAGGINNLIEDTTPQLGGDLDVNGYKIVSVSNGSIELAPNGSGAIVLSGTVTTTDRIVSLATTNAGSDDGLDRGLEWSWQTNGVTRTAKTMTAFEGAPSYRPIEYDYADRAIGRASIKFNGIDQSLYPASTSSDFAFGTGDYTIELFFKKTGIQGSYPQHLVTYSAGDYVIRFSSANTIVVRKMLGTPADLITYSSISDNTWYHLAVSRSGTSLRMFINGTQVGSTYTDSFNLANNTFRLVDDGANPPSTGSLFQGKLDEIRISKGVARYTTNFTAPSEPLQNSANTVLLLHCDGSVVDDAGVAYAVKNGALVWDNSQEKLVYYSDATNTANVISGTLGTVKADSFEGTHYGAHYGDTTGVAQFSTYARGIEPTVQTSGTYHVIIGPDTTTYAAGTTRQTIGHGGNYALSCEVGTGRLNFRYGQLTPMATPSSPSNGQIYYDSTTHKFRGYANGTWVDLH